MIPWEEILLRLVLASLFGAAIGLERERKTLAAGLRTHMMVCVGACLIMLVSSLGFADILGTPNVMLDPSRIASQVVSGIGFIGAGTILFMKQGTVHGLTTASGLWTVAAIGLATGGGMYFAAGVTTAIALIILWGLQQLEHIYSRRYKNKILKIVIPSENHTPEVFARLFEDDTLGIQSLSFEKDAKDTIYIVKFEEAEDSRFVPLMNQLKTISEIKSVFWENA
ncbi:MAG: MgtC/SapB family protein [Saprospiraceae bacterium]|jgi:putative Mg2+ transporter-C (MgtC) family protein|nr:MgtC/SapB family protein [Candidatus Parvibacillus calidus]MBX2936150.1 MgtC/SapB family protein [Saprospiraceae bacterium]MBX7179123.1 MgtC/SapB family protein [Saprospiraceae bacterium]MCB0589898.1 MgtC/SapB family protein [Saprospiraceae bacterium]MCO5283354.1 MgtC/SapB family protein [Saprospiraceae bacterium]